MSIEKLKIESQQELAEMIAKETEQIEKNLTVICNNVLINDRTKIDVLCHDDNGQLVVLQINVNEDDTMLIQGIQSMDYADKFKSFLKATYNKHKIDDKEKPRLILIAPSFSEAMRHAVESMKGMRIDLYEWEYLKLGDHKGLRLQPIFTWNPPEKPYEPKGVKAPEKRSEKTSKKKEQASPPEKKEESTPPLETEPPQESPPEFLQPEPEEPKLEEPFKQEPKETQKRKIKLF
ncbi:MAG: endonuclease NucS [Candidatus Bathyarchaeota archaeon]|nr:endonuclease NucS [Candidatus Bathyarchaeota archaeon]